MRQSTERVTWKDKHLTVTLVGAPVEALEMYRLTVARGQFVTADRGIRMRSAERFLGRLETIAGEIGPAAGEISSEERERRRAELMKAFAYRMVEGSCPAEEFYRFYGIE